MPNIVSRRWFLKYSGLSAAATSASRNCSVLGQTTSVDTKTLVTLDTQKGIDKGLDYLAELQNENGSFGRTDFARNVGIAGLAGMAWISQGSTPRRGKFGVNTQRCVDYILSNARADGFIVAEGAIDRRPMYGHGFATMFLCQAYGMSRSPALRDTLAAAIKIIIASQNDLGGWRYEPQRSDADVSVTACQLTALRAAKNAGFYVPNDVIQGAVKYVASCQNTDGGFAYQVGQGESQFARSAAAVVALFGAGVYDGPVVERGVAYLREPVSRRDEQYYYYGNFYAAQAMWQSGTENWHAWFPMVRDKLLRLQRPDGSWTDPIGAAYATSMALIILQMENGYVPLFQK